MSVHLYWRQRVVIKFKIIHKHFLPLCVCIFPYTQQSNVILLLEHLINIPCASYISLIKSQNIQFLQNVRQCISLKYTDFSIALGGNLMFTIPLSNKATFWPLTIPQHENIEEEHKHYCLQESKSLSLQFLQLGIKW